MMHVEKKVSVVHPATYAYAAEALEALKAGKVIALPTDTVLYGFSCTMDFLVMLVNFTDNNQRQSQLDRSLFLLHFPTLR
ncbi:hypothetical protein RIF29_27675 [Crotalaria pallida]|uniref:Uncharacterized protein n=1 Tax=Crotalaria pallida TaxID=3830 RepID=A0AAN9EQ66_CROPI